jgi:hypothetical protein
MSVPQTSAAAVVPTIPTGGPGSVGGDGARKIAPSFLSDKIKSCCIKLGAVIIGTLSAVFTAVAVVVSSVALIYHKYSGTEGRSTVFISKCWWFTIACIISPSAKTLASQNDFMNYINAEYVKKSLHCRGPIKADENTFRVSDIAPRLASQEFYAKENYVPLSEGTQTQKEYHYILSKSKYLFYNGYFPNRGGHLFVTKNAQAVYIQYLKNLEDYPDIELFLMKGIHEIIPKDHTHATNEHTV